MENMFLVLVIPGPEEPVQMNSILVLLVDELKELRQEKSVGGIFINPLSTKDEFSCRKYACR